MGGKNIVKKH